MKFSTICAIVMGIAIQLVVASHATDTKAAGAADSGGVSFELPCLSAAAGVNDSSESYRISWTAGEVAVGGGESELYVLRLGYWASCACAYQADFDGNDVLDSVDLNGLIQAIFFNGSNPQDPDCSTTRGDFDNSGYPDSVDLNRLINHLFFNGEGPCDPCDPVQGSCAP